MNRISLQIFEKWSQDEKNMVILTGFATQGTIAQQIKDRANQEIITPKGNKFFNKSKVNQISFCAHADFEQTKKFIRKLEPDYVVLVHGQKDNAIALQKKLVREFDKIKKVVAPPTEISNQKHPKTEEFYFETRQTCKIVGELSSQINEECKKFDALLEDKINLEDPEK